MKPELLQQIAEERRIAEGLIRYYQRAIDDNDRLIAEANVKVDKAVDAYDEQVRNFNEGPAKIEACKRTLAALDHKLKLDHVQPKLDKIARLKAEIASLEAEV